MKLLSASSATPPVMDQDKVLHTWQTMSTAQGNGLATQAEWRRIHAHVDTTRHSGRVPGFRERPLTLDDTVLEATMLDRVAVDQDDQIYQCLVRQLIVKEPDAYDLVLVDEAQDLNRMGHTFLDISAQSCIRTAQTSHFSATWWHPRPAEQWCVRSAIQCKPFGIGHKTESGREIGAQS